jgi:hypothetical protein
VRRALRVYLWIFVGLSVAGWLPEIAGRLGAQWVNADYAALYHQFDTFESNADFHDLLNFDPRRPPARGQEHTDAAAPTSYPPVTGFVYALLLRPTNHPVALYLSLFAAVLAGFGWVLARALGREAGYGLTMTVAWLTMAFGYPQIFTATRGNIEWVNCGLTVLALLAFVRRRYLWTALLLGLAVCIKPFPVIFFLLLLWRRRYREVAAGAAFAGALSLVAFAARGPSIAAAMHALSVASADYYARYVLVVRVEMEMRFNHTLLDLVKIPIWFVYDHQQYDPRMLTAGMPGVPLWARLDLWAHALLGVAVVAMAWIAWHFRRMPMLNGIFALAIAEMLLPYSAADYTLLLMLAPWGFLLVLLTRDAAIGAVRLSASEMTRLLVPCAILFYLFWQVARIPLPCSVLGELGEDDRF